jgi:hypothetical protein
MAVTHKHLPVPHPFPYSLLFRDRDITGRSRSMERFLIEVPHEAEPLACIVAVRTLLELGSHFLTNADFGCCDNEHKGWLTIEAESKEDAQRVVPPPFRAQARITRLNRFSLEELDALYEKHGGKTEAK